MKEQPIPETNSPPQKPKEGLIYQVGRWIVRILFSVLVTFLLLSLIVQLPVVQTGLARYITNELSEYLGVTVSVNRLRLAFFDRVILEGFLVEDPQCDTVLTCERLTAGINSNIFTLIRRGLEVDELSIRSAALNMQRPQGTPHNNFKALLDQLFPPKPRKSRRPFQFRLKKLYLDNVQFQSDDVVKGERLYARVTQGFMWFKKMDLPGKKLVIEQCILDRAAFQIESVPEMPLPTVLSTALGRTATADDDTTAWQITLKDFDFSRGTFSLHNLRKAPIKTTPDDQLDFEHLEVSDIAIRLKNIRLNADSLIGSVEKIAAQTSSGFVLKQLTAKEVKMNARSIALNGMEMLTPESRVGDTLVFSFEQYADFEDFTSAVRMDARLHTSFLAVKDLLVFAPKLTQNAFFRNNLNERFQIEGRVRGAVNDLSGRNLEIALGQGAFLKGRLDMRDIAVPGQGFFVIDMQEARTSMRVLQQIIPRFNLPDNFDRLGRLQFRGNLTGFFATGFTIIGDLRTDLGPANLSMTLNPNGGKERATYSGDLSLQNFDLGAWTGNSHFGKVSLSASLKEGRSLVASSASAKVAAQVKSFSYKKYEYKNAVLSGALNRNFFNGDFNIRDENVDFTFNGKLDFTQSVPVFNFKADVKKIDFKTLNLAKKDIILAGQFELNARNNKLANIEGEARINDLAITLNQDETFSMDRVDIQSYFTMLGERVLRLDSEIANIEVNGIFEPEQLPAIFIHHLHRNHAAFARQLHIKPPKRTPAPSRFHFKANILASRGFNHLLSPELHELRDFHLAGGYRYATDSLELELSIPSFQYGTLRIEQPFLIWNAKNGVAELETGFNNLYLNDKQVLANPLLLGGLAYKDSLRFAITYRSAGAKILETLYLDGVLAAVDSTALSLHFEQSNLTLMNRLWVINPENRIIFSKEVVNISKMVLTHQNYRIGLENFGKRGARVVLFNLDFHLIDKYWDYPQLEFGGLFNVQIWVEDLIKMEKLNLSVVANTLTINDDDWGSLHLDASAPNLKSRVTAILSLENDTAQIYGRGYYNLQEIIGRGASRNFQENRKKFFLANFNLSGIPLRTMEYFLKGIVSGTQGSVSGDITFSGTPGDPHLDGSLLVNSGRFSVNYLKTTYRINQAVVKMNDLWLFQVVNTNVLDKYSHTARVTGGLRHSKLKDLRIDATLNTTRFLALDTKKGDNKQFYGQALGSGYVRFTGPVDRIDAYIKGSVNDSTRLVIPISSEREAQSISYVNFVNRRAKPVSEGAPPPPPAPKGMNIEMDLTVGRESVMQIVFNEQAGDILEGTGRGNIRILLPRNGDFQMFGDYSIEEGDYLFTLYGVINKKFRVQRGGSIKWSGDPYKAIIRLDAEYKGINTPVSVFIADFLAAERPQLKSEASKATQVNLVLHLAGELFQPQINFDIEFPLLTGELKNYTDSKLRILKQDPNELNRQAFGLIVAGQFLPSDLNNVQAPDVIYNTVSELVSNQLSLFLTDLFSDFIEDGRVLSGIDFQVAYSQYRPGDAEQSFGRGEEFEVRLRQSLFNDRLSVVVGGNYDSGGRAASAPGVTTGAFFGNDLVIEYALTPDRSLTLKVYQRLQPDIGGRRLKVGAGISFRKEYDSFTEFVQSIRLAGKRNKNNS